MIRPILYGYYSSDITQSNSIIDEYLNSEGQVVEVNIVLPYKNISQTQYARLKLESCGQVVRFIRRKRK